MRWRVALVVALALVASGCRAGGPKVAPPTANTTVRPAVASSSAPATGRAADSRAAATSTASGGEQQLTQTLAAAGVATVADELATAPAVGVTGSTVLTLTAWQVANLDSEAASHGGLTGADLDSMLPMPADTPTFADIVGGWVIANGDATATAAGVLLSSPDWTHPEQ